MAVPDAKYGEVVGAWVVRRHGSSVSRDEVRASVADFMNPQVCAKYNGVGTRRY